MANDWKSAYSQKLRDPRWQKMRLEIMGRDKFSCRLCGDDKSTLNVHHLYYERGADPWDYHEQSLVTLCEACHEEMHISRFGESILEALIVGGAGLSNLYGVMYALQGAFSDGPYQVPIPRERWEHAVGAITYAIEAVQRGATEGQVRDALKDLGVR